MDPESKEPKMLRGRERRGLPTRTPPFLIWGEVMVALSVLTHESEQESRGGRNHENVPELPSRVAGERINSEVVDSM